MNPRVLELIKNPKNIQLEDLNLLKEEIHAFPYIQNIRALHLYGVHLYEKENYQKELSTTAAYTTDKKILYQLINGKIRQEPKPEPVEEKKPSKTADKTTKYPYYKGFPIKREETSSPKMKEEEKVSCLLPTPEDIKHIYVNGERNRILFEGEENFLDEKNSDIIDLESTLESGTLVTQKSEAPEEFVEDKIQHVQEENGESTEEEFTPETIINEDEISSGIEEEKVDNEEDVSFHETESLLPEIHIEENVSEEPVKIETITGDEEISASHQEPTPNEPDAELSFHRTDEFMPDVKMQINNEEVTESAEVSLPNVNRHEEEMRRLIEEVEKKMKETKAAPEEKIEVQEIVEDHEISFAETQNFHFWSTEKDESPKAEEVKEEPVKEPVIESQKIVEKDEPEKAVVVEEVLSEVEVQSAWKPMSVESNLPDSLINKKASEISVSTPIASEEKVPVAQEIIQEDVLPSEETGDVVKKSQEDTIAIKEETTEAEENQSENSEEAGDNSIVETSKDEVPVMNVSFFGTDISTLKVQEQQKENKEKPVEDEKVKEAIMKNTQAPVDSNVPGFINTWQSWLKIGRTEEVKVEKEVIKEKAIETFIENNPRISQLKEESSYIVKEKNDDISHLMTETLANLYFEQKLYTKAIKAFEILIKKNPEKKKYFESKIQEIKDFRSKN
nr:hypothetical protein [uncultured Chryseobacterium sp.]